MAQSHKSGDDVITPGVYRVVHGAHHASEYEVTCVLGKKFPPCHYCGQDVQFLLARPAQNIEYDPNFKLPECSL